MQRIHKNQSSDTNHTRFTLVNIRKLLSKRKKEEKAKKQKPKNPLGTVISTSKRRRKLRICPRCFIYPRTANSLENF